jgi:hypothetical protein
MFVGDEESLKPDEIFFEDDNMIIFPNREGHQRSTSGKSAAMSYVHMMIVPKVRIYNCVSLRPEHIALMRKIQNMAQETLLSPRVKEYYLSGRELDLAEDVMDPQYLDLFVHCHPSHGIGHFTVHACLRNLWTTGQPTEIS